MENVCIYVNCGRALRGAVVLDLRYSKHAISEASKTPTCCDVRLRIYGMRIEWKALAFGREKKINVNIALRSYEWWQLNGVDK